MELTPQNYLEKCEALFAKNDEFEAHKEATKAVFEKHQDWFLSDENKEHKVSVKRTKGPEKGKVQSINRIDLWRELAGSRFNQTTDAFAWLKENKPDLADAIIKEYELSDELNKMQREEFGFDPQGATLSTFLRLINLAIVSYVGTTKNTDDGAKTK